MNTTKAITPVEIKGVHGYIDAKGTAWLKLEDVARGLGFVMRRNDRVTTSGDSYEAVRWNRVRQYLEEINFSQDVGENPSDAFVPEHVFYRLAMKANNAVANAFQEKIANEILPAIRKHGFYATPDAVEQIISDPDSFIKILTALKEERAKNTALTQAIQTLEPKANYCDIILNCPDTVTTTVIAKDYGYSAVKFNEKLPELKIQFKYAIENALRRQTRQKTRHYQYRVDTTRSNVPV